MTDLGVRQKKGFGETSWGDCSDRSPAQLQVRILGRRLRVRPSSAVNPDAELDRQVIRLDLHRLPGRVEVAPQVSRLDLRMTELPLLEGERWIAEELPEEAARVLQVPEAQFATFAAGPDDPHTGRNAFHPRLEVPGLVSLGDGELRAGRSCKD